VFRVILYCLSFVIMASSRDSTAFRRALRKLSEHNIIVVFIT